LTVGVIFASALLVLYALARWTVSTGSGEDGSSHLYFPSNLEQLKDVVTKLAGVQLYKVLPLFCAAYLFKQTFAIPGSMLLNLLAGALFGWKVGFLLSSVLTATGATFCYLLAKFLGKEVAEKYFPKALVKFQQQMSANQNRLPYFLLFLRLFPCSPNWAINMCSGVLGVPMHLFFLTVLFGLGPYNYICVQTGDILTSIKTLSDIFTVGTMLQLTGVAFVALAPTLFVNNCEGRKPTSKVAQY